MHHPDKRIILYRPNNASEYNVIGQNRFVYYFTLDVDNGSNLDYYPLMRTLTYAKLIEALSKPGATFVCVESLTDAKALKKNRITKEPNAFGDIFKKSRAVVVVGSEYESAVQRQAVREGVSGDTFVADELPWGRWFIPNKVIEHKGEFYLRTQTTEGMRRKRPAIVRYIDKDGNRLNHSEIKDVLPEAKGSDKQEAWGVTGEVRVRTVKFSNILRMRLNGETVVLAKD